jgi:hypothetical protein
MDVADAGVVAPAAIGADATVASTIVIASAARTFRFVDKVRSDWIEVQV